MAHRPYRTMARSPSPDLIEPNAACIRWPILGPPGSPFKENKTYGATLCPFRAWGLERGAASTRSGRLGIVELETAAHEGVHEIDFQTLDAGQAYRIDQDRNPELTCFQIISLPGSTRREDVLGARAAPGLQADAHAGAGLTGGGQQALDLVGSVFGEGHQVSPASHG